MRKYANPTSNIEFEIQNIDGEWKIITAKKLTINCLKYIDKISQDKSKNIFDIMKEQMVYIFGGNEEDYDNYDARILSAILRDLTQELQNPLQKTQN